jgi:hypothetical protein
MDVDAGGSRNAAASATGAGKPWLGPSDARGMIMDAAALKSLVMALLAWINLNGGYEIPPGEPEIVFVPKTELEQIACRAPCPIMAFFPNDQLEQIYILEGLDVGSDVCARSILLHELVHYAQEYAGSFSEFTPKVRNHRREMEALQVQSLYLAQRGRRLTIGNGFALRGLPGPSC